MAKLFRNGRGACSLRSNQAPLERVTKCLKHYRNKYSACRAWRRRNASMTWTWSMRCRQRTIGFAHTHAGVRDAIRSQSSELRSAFLAEINEI